MQFVRLAFSICLLAHLAGSCSPPHEGTETEVKEVAKPEVPPQPEVAQAASTPEASTADRELDEAMKSLLKAKDSAGLDLTDLMLTPEFAMLMESTFEGWEPSPEDSERLTRMRQMLIMMSPQAPDSVPQTEDELNRYAGNVTVVPKDPEMVRELIDSLLAQDPEGFIDTFIAALEDYSAEKLMNPNAETSATVKIAPKKEANP